MEKANSIVIVAGIIERDGRYLLVQEAKPQCYKQWNIPAGHLELGENILDGAKREIREETGCDVKLTGLCQVGNCIHDDHDRIYLVFTTTLLNDKPKIEHPEEILDLGWFTYEEILDMRDQIRNIHLVIESIDSYRQGITTSLDIINIYSSSTTTNHRNGGRS